VEQQAGAGSERSLDGDARQRDDGGPVVRMGPDGLSAGGKGGGSPADHAGSQERGHELALC